MRIFDCLVVAIVCLLVPVAATSAQFVDGSVHRGGSGLVSSSDPTRTSDQWAVQNQFGPVGTESASAWGAINSITGGRPLGTSEFRTTSTVLWEPLTPPLVMASGMGEVTTQCADGVSLTYASARFGCSVTFELASAQSFLLEAAFDLFVSRDPDGYSSPHADSFLQLWTVDAAGDWETPIVNHWDSWNDGALSRDYASTITLGPGRYALTFAMHLESWSSYRDGHASGSGSLLMIGVPSVPCPVAAVLVMAIPGGMYRRRRCVDA